jgi:hypothetical protein
MTETDFRDWERQLSSANACSHPIRLRGRITAIDLATGESATAYTTDTEPGRVLHVACGNRRESACPACSVTYKRDARQLVRSGLIGGKGIPETVAEHPCIFATFTAPSFGPVHARRERNGKVLACRPRRDACKRACPHGRDISCPVRHHEEDSRLGRPMCGDCYAYESAVVFNASAGDLWRRFTTYLPRQLARMMGVTQKELRSLVRLRFVKVAEYQARGVVHFHAIIRLDANTDDDSYAPPPRALDRRRPRGRHPSRGFGCLGHRRRRQHRQDAAYPVRRADRHPDHPLRHFRRAHPHGGRELHRQVRH